MPFKDLSGVRRSAECLLFVLWLCIFPVGNMLGQNVVSVHQQELADTLDVAVVTAKTKPSPNLQSTPLQVMQQKDFAVLGMKELHEAVKTFSGVQIKDYGGIGGVKTVSVRSLGTQHTAISYDGVTVSNAQSGQVDIGRFNLSNVEMISLSIGQVEDIFQTARMFASAGVLSIRTAKPEFNSSNTNLGAAIGVGSFGTYNPSAYWQQKLSDKWSFAVNGDWLTSDGNYPYTLKNGTSSTREKRLNSDVNTIRAEANVYGNLGRGGELTFKANWMSSQRGLPGSVIYYNPDARERLWDEAGFVQAHYSNKLSGRWALKGQLKYNYAWNKYRDENESYQGGARTDYYTQRELYGSVSAKYAAAENVNVVLSQDFFRNTLDTSFENFCYPERYTSLTALAARYDNGRLSATASLLSTFITENLERGAAAPDRFRLSPSVSVSYKLFKEHNLRIRGSYQDIFRTPTFNDLYYDRVGNSSLNPEIARQVNLGFTWRGMLGNLLDDISLQVDAFYNKVEEKIVALPTLFVWRMLNMGEVEIKGLDVNLGISLPLSADFRVRMQGNYSYQYAVDVTDPSSKNYRDQIPYTPRHSGNVSLSILNRWVNVGYIMSVVGDRYALPQNIAWNRMIGYVEHSVSLEKGFEAGKCRWNLQVECQNLTDKQYDVIQYYPMPGRSLRVTLKFEY
ncbi:MAG: TonB-dependent receptor [Bacteroidales bacterium]|nr:TonB-dependent receptor [Bacteroidales bacterium]